MLKTIKNCTYIIVLLGIYTKASAQESDQVGERFSSKKFRSWSVGFQAGVLSPNTIITGTVSDWQTAKENLGYGAFIKKQLIPSFGIQVDFLAGKMGGVRPLAEMEDGFYEGSEDSYSEKTSYETRLEWSASLSFVYNIANVNLNKRSLIWIPYAKAGAGYLSSSANVTGKLDSYTTASDKGYHKNWFIPVGLGFKLGIAKGVNLDFGYDVNFVKSMIFDGNRTIRDDKFAYGHAGVEFAIGSKSKPQLQNYNSFVNVSKQSNGATDSLKAALSASETKVKNIEDKYARDLADDDSDGVANKFDKCPATIAGVVVDGSGCPIISKTETIQPLSDVTGYEAVNFDFAVSELKTESYKTLDKLSALLRANGNKVVLNGYTSNEGTQAYNVKLSTDRAQAVKTYLINSGVNSSQLSIKGNGEQNPIASNDSEEGRIQNRRVEASRN